MQSITCVAGLSALLILGAGCGQAERNHADANAGGSAAAAGTSQGGAKASGGSGGRSTEGGRTGGGAGGDAGLGGIGDGPGPCGVPATSQLPRLTNDQYDRTVRDLLGVTGLSAFADEAPSAMLAADHVGDLTASDWDAYSRLAETLAAQVMTTPAQRSRFIGCEFSGDGSQCLRDTIVEFGRRAFRRPLTDSEVQRFQTFIDARAQITEKGTANEVAQVILETFLMSPSFIQRAEISGTPDANGTVALSSYEVASRLSYTLWGSMPDAVLDDAANRNQLATNDQIRAQGERMLQDPKAREVVTAFHRAYLGFGPGSHWATTKKDPSLFPAFTQATATASLAELDRFLDDVVFSQKGSFRDLFESPIAFVNADTAAIYGLDASSFGASLEKVLLDPEQRPGFLTRIGFLASFSNYARTSPSNRGAFVERLLGVNAGPVHEVSVSGPPVSEPLTNRQRTESLTAGNASCKGCHEIVDPPGFVLENYDTIGAWQTVERDTGLPIDTVADVDVDGSKLTLRTPAELMRAVALSTGAQRNYARSWVDFSIQRDDTAIDRCVADTLALRIAEPSYTVLDLLIDYTQTDSFQSRMREEP